LTDGVTNLELTAAYSTIANQGVYNKPVFYTKVVDHNGKVLLDNTKPKKRTVLKASTAYALTQALTDVVKYGTGKQVDFGTMPVAGKTGTTSSTYDVWFSGFTPYYACSIWGGYDVNTSMHDASYHKKLWNKIMGRVHEGLEYKEFQVPDSMVPVKVCQTSGKLATASCPSITEYFDKGEEPTAVCGMHVGNYTDNHSGEGTEGQSADSPAAEPTQGEQPTEQGGETGAEGQPTEGTQEGQDAGVTLPATSQ